jgi:hypothetical protein
MGAPWPHGLQKRLNPFIAAHKVTKLLYIGMEAAQGLARHQNLKKNTAHGGKALNGLKVYVAWSMWFLLRISNKYGSHTQNEFLMKSVATLK